MYADLKSIDDSCLGNKFLSKEKLKECNKKAYTSFYLRWSYVWKRLKKTTSFGEFKTNVAGLRMLIDLVK
jgi:hypothetical protein